MGAEGGAIMARKKSAEGEHWDRVDEYHRNARHVVVDVTWEGYDGLYSLRPAVERRIREAHPDAPVNVRGLLIESDSKENIDRFQRPYWAVVAQMVTGLTPEQIRGLGGVDFFDLAAGKVLWSWQRDVKEAVLGRAGEGGQREAT
jgi:hypothetical protein